MWLKLDEKISLLAIFRANTVGTETGLRGYLSRDFNDKSVVIGYTDGKTIQSSASFSKMVDKVKKGFKKVTNKKAYLNDKKMAQVEKKLKFVLANIKKFSYQVEAIKEKSGYAYDINLIFKCQSEKEARYLEELAMAWLAYTGSKAKTSQDMVSFKSNKVMSSGDACVFSVKLGASKAEQYQFSSLMMNLMMQDRRFRVLFR